jgi:uncharacterized protein (UPF0332 family)
VTDENRRENARVELEAARQALAAARALAALGLWGDAVSRAYYASFHAATAALFSLGLQARTHSGTHNLLFEHFVKPGLLDRSVAKNLSALQQHREAADYRAGSGIDATVGAEQVQHAAEIVAAVEALLRLRGVVS